MNVNKLPDLFNWSLSQNCGNQMTWAKHFSEDGRNPSIHLFSTTYPVQGRAYPSCLHARGRVLVASQSHDLEEILCFKKGKNKTGRQPLNIKAEYWNHGTLNQKDEIKRWKYEVKFKNYEIKEDIIKRGKFNNEKVEMRWNVWIKDISS